MIANAAKVFQRRLYDLLVSRAGVAFLLTAFLVLIVSLLHFGEVLFQWSSERYHAFGPPVASTDNLGGRSFLAELSPPMPVDIVYTWVNGSDPRLLTELEHYQKIFFEEERAAKLAAAKAAKPSNTSLAPKCIWIDCNRFADWYLLRCPPATNLNALEVSVVERTNSCVVALASTNASVPAVCTNFSVFLTPDSRPTQKILYPNALWISGEMFREKKADNTFVNQLWLIFEHVKAPSQHIQLLPFENGVVLLCNPACNRTIISSTLNTFIALRLTWSPIFLVWNDTVPGGADLLDASGDSGENDRTSRSRYEDNEELRYSLRSVDEFAPWIRRVYLVTNGQVPAWLRLDHPRLRVVTHRDIFANASHLPTFNSAAIEMHLHRIPGLSRFFIYMNDDVFFGAPVYPDDFFTHARGQRVYLSWAVPDCRPGCPSNWLKDGYCDKACNHPECEFDAGDCAANGQNSGPYAAAVNAWAAAMQRTSAQQAIPYRPFCHSTCADTWLGDGSCDSPCNYRECAFDAGDCGDRNLAQLCAAQFRHENWTAELPQGVTEAVVDLRTLGQNLTWSSGRYLTNSPYSVRSVVLAKKYQVLLLVFHKNVNRTELLCNLQAGNVTRNLSIVAHTNGNGTCPDSMLYRVVEASRPPGVVFPTMKPYAPDERSPKTNVKLVQPPSFETVQQLEEKLWARVNRSPNSSESLLLAKSAKDLEKKWMGGEITEKGYRFFLWELLTGSPLRITADRRRVGFFLSPTSTASSRHRRRLLGTYAQSLIHSNRLFSHAYGHSPRKVPGHMPHFLDVRVLHELESHFSKQWRQTSQHRIRSSNDLQYAFAYFYFLMSERVNRTLPDWLSTFDSDRSKQLDSNELRSLALHLWGLPFDEKKLNSTLSNCSLLYSPDEDHSSPISIDALVNCRLFYNISAPHLTNASRYRFEVAGEEEIWFKMLNANYSRAVHHLDEIRSQRRKFMCLNDDIDHAGNPIEAAKVRRAMGQLLTLLFPRPCQFELPRGSRHNFRYRDEWLRALRWQRTLRSFRILVLALFVTFVSFVLFRRQCRKGLLRTFRCLRKKKCCGGKSPVKV